MMTCKEALYHVACADMENLSWRERRILKRHVKVCPPCKDYADQIRSIQHIARKKTAGLELTEDELQQLKASIMECCPDNEADEAET